MYKNILIALLLVLNFVQVKASSSVPTFIIYGDSVNIKEAYDIKNQLLKEFEEVVKGLDEKDYEQAILDYFVYEKGSYDNHTLTIVVGDGKGTILKGKLKTNYCKIEKDEIETDFFFKKIWQKATS